MATPARGVVPVAMDCCAGVHDPMLARFRFQSWHGFDSEVGIGFLRAWGFRARAAAKVMAPLRERKSFPNSKIEMAGIFLNSKIGNVKSFPNSKIWSFFVHLWEMLYMDLIRILSDQREELECLDLSSIVPRMEEGRINLASKLAQVVIGVRRSGKSTICQKVLLESGVKFGYVNFDDENLVNLRPEQLNDIIETLYRMYGSLDYLFFDEIQNIKDVWPVFVNRLLRQGKHVIITGSNANLLSGELATHLTGRYHQIENFPFSFMEYCNMLGLDTVSQSTLSRGLRQKALDEYLIKGGMPEIVSDHEYSSYVKGLVESVITKDICKRHNIRNVESMRKLVNLILDITGQEIQTSELARKVEMSQPTVANYLKYLKESYLIREVPVFSHKNLDRQKLRKYYAIDVSFMSNHDYAFGSPGFGWRLENVVALELMRRINSESDQLFYLKKNKSYEVDFVVVKSGRVDELIQVSYDFSNPSLKLRNRELMGLVKGADAVGCDRLTLVISEGEPRTEIIEGKRINIVKASEWLLPGAGATRGSGLRDRSVSVEP